MTLKNSPASHEILLWRSFLITHQQGSLSSHLPEATNMIPWTNSTHSTQGDQRVLFHTTVNHYPSSELACYLFEGRHSFKTLLHNLMISQSWSLPGAIQEEQQAALELIGHGLAASKTMSSEPWRGRVLRTCPEDLMLLLSIALLITFMVTMSPIIYEFYENSKGVSSPSLCYVLLVLTVIVIDFFQALLLEWINDSTTTLKKNLDIYIVSKVKMFLLMALM